MSWKMFENGIKSHGISICNIFLFTFLFPLLLLSFLLQLNDHIQEIEEEAMTKAVELEKQLSEANSDLEYLRVCII